jgi:hypothetical protein
LIHEWRTVAMIGAICAGPFAACADSPSFAKNIAPVLQEKCAACHLTGDEAGKLALYKKAAYANLVAHPSVESAMLRVKPGEPDSSYLMRKLQGTHLDAGGKGAQMPLGGPTLDADFMELLRQWIKDGAANN